MAGLPYVGIDSTANGAVLDRLAVTTQIAAATPSRVSVTDQVNAAAGATYATINYVNTQDTQFAAASYYVAQDANNIPPSAKGLADASLGVAALDSGGKVPLAQLPVLGNGYVLGSFGPTATTAATTGATAARIVDWNLGVKNIRFRPWVFMSLFASASDLGRPVVEVWLANSTTAPDYGVGSLVAKGVARSHYNDFSVVTVVPIPSAAAQSGPAGLASTTNIWVTAWLYDLHDHQVVFNSTNLAAASVYLLRDLQ